MPTFPRLNTLLVVADDHAANAVGCYGGPQRTTYGVTPNIDRVAEEGVRFDECGCTNSLCSPSRATILTGTYNHVNGVTTLSTEFDARQPAFPELLRDAGYRTALVGKWHLGHGDVHDPRGDALVLNVDFAQTFLDLAGVDPHPRMQGRSMRPLLDGVSGAEAGWREAAYYRYWEHLDGIHDVAAHRGVRTRDRKLVHYYGSGCDQPGASSERTEPEWELFDLERDPKEIRSVVHDPAYADDLARMRSLLDRLAEELGDELPRGEPVPVPDRDRPDRSRPDSQT